MSSATAAQRPAAVLGSLGCVRACGVPTGDDIAKCHAKAVVARASTLGVPVLSELAAAPACLVSPPAACCEHWHRTVCRRGVACQCCEVGRGLIRRHSIAEASRAAGTLPTMSALRDMSAEEEELFDRIHRIAEEQLFVSVDEVMGWVRKFGGAWVDHSHRSSPQLPPRPVFDPPWALFAPACLTVRSCRYATVNRLTAILDEGLERFRGKKLLNNKLLLNLYGANVFACSQSEDNGIKLYEHHGLEVQRCVACASWAECGVERECFVGASVRWATWAARSRLRIPRSACGAAV